MEQRSAPADDEAKRQESLKKLEDLMAKPLEVVEPFPFETLDADLRRNVLTFVLTAPTDGATSALRVVTDKRRLSGALATTHRDDAHAEPEQFRQGGELSFPSEKGAIILVHIGAAHLWRNQGREGPSPQGFWNLLVEADGAPVPWEHVKTEVLSHRHAGCVGKLPHALTDEGLTCMRHSE